MDRDASGRKTLLTRATQLVRSATHPAAQLPVEGRLPGFDGATGWLNSPPLTAADLRGKVVLVQFWTYTCINWLRTLPYVRAWAGRYQDQGLVVVGVHTPEFDFEHDLGNVRRQVEELGVEYPVAVDNDYAIWDGFGNRYWPALYFVDAQGQIRHHRFGEGDYQRSEMILQHLLGEARGDGIDRDLVSVEATGVEAAADWDSLWSPENYLGASRTENFASANGAVLDTPHRYGAPPRLRLNQWGLSGDWTVTRGAIVLNEPDGWIAYRFHARDLHLVMAPAAPGSPIRFRVRIDGQPPGPAHGADVDDQGNGTLTDPRLYQLVRQPGPVGDRTFEVTFLDPGVQAYASPSASLEAWRGGPGRAMSRGDAIVEGATVSVAVVASRTEAEVIAGMLRSHGVGAAVSADDAGGQYPQMQIEGVRVLVAPSDEATARRLLAAADDTSADGTS